MGLCHTNPRLPTLDAEVSISKIVCCTCTTRKKVVSQQYIIKRHIKNCDDCRRMVFKHFTITESPSSSMKVSNTPPQVEEHKK